MTTNNPGDNDIDDLALRAKEMLERVRGAKDPGATTAATTTTSSSKSAATSSSKTDTSDSTTGDDAKVIDDGSRDLDTDADDATEVIEDELSDDSGSDAEGALKEETDAEDSALDDVDSELLDAEEPVEEPEVEAVEDAEVVEEVEVAETTGFEDLVSQDPDLDDADLDEVPVDEVVVDDGEEVSELLTDDDSIRTTGFEDLIVDDVDESTIDASGEDIVPEIESEDLEITDVESDAESNVLSGATGFEDLIVDDPEVSVDDVSLDFDEAPAADVAEEAELVEETDLVADADAGIAYDDMKFEDLEFDDVEFEDIEVGDASSTTEFSFGGREADTERLADAENEPLTLDDSDVAFDEVSQTSELADTDDFASSADLGDEPVEVVDLDADEIIEPDVEGFGDNLIDEEMPDTATIATEDLVAEIEELDATPTVAGLSLGAEPAIDSDMPLSESGSSVVSGAATSSLPPKADKAKVKARDRGRLSDLSNREEPAPETKQRGRQRRPNVDHDLNELFLKGEAPAQAQSGRSIGWFLPLILLAAFVLGFLWWAAGQTGDSGDSVQNEAQSETAEDSTAPTSDVTTDTAPVEEEAAPTTAEATSTTTTEAETFGTAWELIGDASNTGAFGAFAGPLGLQEILEEQRADEDDNPIRFTLLAPSDSAVANLSQEQLDALSADPQAAAQLLNYHIIDMPLTPEFLLEDSGGELISRSGVPILIDFEDGQIVFNGEARIELAGLEAQNGSILVIDSILSPPTVNQILDLGNITFATLSSRITPEGQTELQRAVTYFNENPDQSATIEGHTDTDGEAQANLGLSQRRADAVRQFLIDNGIGGDRLVAEGFGETVPVIVDGVENKDASRRIEFILQ